LWATCPEDPIRDGGQALDHAQRVIELVGENNAAILDSLSAAYAELGDFQQAVHWPQKAVEMAGKGIKDDLAARLDLYKQGKPFREKPQGGPYRESH
jgi:tetratricopeptide (TPR) repeat protein